MPVITLTPKDVIKGESTADWVSDRGFSPDSYQLNLTKIRGLIHFIEGGTDRGGATLTGNVIAYAYDKNFLGNDLYYLDDEGAFYTLDGPTLTKRQTSTADTYQLGTSDMLQFKGSTYATGQGRVAKLDNSDLTTIDSGWWTGLQSSYRHPLEVVEDTMYIADKNEIHTWDGTTSTAAAITLPTDVNVTSLRKHSNGRDLIAFCGLTANFSHTLGASGRIYIIDTVLKDWTREIELESQVEGSRNVGGVIYVTYGMNVGYFNGDGLSFIRKLATSGTTYSHSMGSMESVLLVRDGLNVLAYGDLGLGKVWWNLFRNVANSASVSTVAYKGDNVVTFTYANSGAGICLEIDFDNIGGNGILYLNKYFFENEVIIRKIEIIHDATQIATRFILYYRDSEGNSNIIEDKTHGFAGPWRTRVQCDIQTDIFQLAISPLNDDLGWKFIKIHYDPIK